MPKPLISVLTPTYNRAAKYLPQTIQAVQMQREVGCSHEHIIIDNASTDKTRQVVAAFAKQDPRIVYIRNRKNLLASGALNVGFNASKGKLILPLDDDDLIPPHALQWYADFMVAHPRLQWAIAHTLYIDDENKFLGRANQPVVIQNFRKFLVRQIRVNTITNGAVIVRRAAIKQVGGWDESFPASQDAVLWLRLIHAEQPVAIINQYLGMYRVHQQRLSTSHVKTAMWKLVKERLMLQYNITQKQLDAIKL